MIKKILVTGGGGYCGARLVPQLLESSYEVTVLDKFWFQSEKLFKAHENLKLVKGDIRDSYLLNKSLWDQDCVVHLACISNDASFELDEQLSTSINLDAFGPLVEASKNAGVKKFIYASSSSVYGVSDKENVTEDHPLVPLTLYNKFKGMCEPILTSFTDSNFTGVIFRPATVCGYSPRQRLDLSVNILTNLAVNTGKITVFGGSQMRPNLHIQDYCDVVKLFIESDPSIIQNKIYNVGNQNMTISELAVLVKRIVEEEFNLESIEILTSSSDDNRSYHIDSTKIKNELGFTPKYSIEDAVRELCHAFKTGLLPNSLSDANYFNVKKLKLIRAQ